MKTISTSIIFTLLAALAHTLPAPVPQPICNPNPHGRSCSATLFGAAGVKASINIPLDFQLHNTGVDFSVSSIYNPDNSQYEYVTLYGSDGSVTEVAPGATTAVGPPQVQTSAFCQIICPS